MTPAPADPKPAALHVISCHIKPTSLRALIAARPPSLRVSKRLGHALLTARPQLAEHACQDRGLRRFGETLAGSTLPHAVEHLVIDLLVEACPGHVFAGTTTWDDREQGIMQVRVGLAKSAQTRPTSEANNAEDNAVVGQAATHIPKEAFSAALETAVCMVNLLEQTEQTDKEDT
jgi:hypothetical protein